MGDSETPPARTPLVPVLAACALLWALYLLTADDPVLGMGAARGILLSAAVATTALLAVLVAGATILGIAPSLTGTPPTGFQRVIVYALLTFAATFVTLRQMGFDLGAVLTTSAIVTATVGFAMQPTLASMIAGLALHADRAIHVGDAIMLDGEPVEITSLNWRAALGRRPDGKLVVIPNGKLSDATTEVLQAGRAHRAELFFAGPIGHPPQPICELLREAVSDLALVDPERPVAVAPVGFEPEKEATRFRIQYWTRAYGERSLIEGEAVRRIWYLFQRHRIALPHATTAGAAYDLDAALLNPEEIAPQIETWLGTQRPALLNLHGLAQSLAKKTRLLLYAPDERITLPEWSEGWSCLLWRGEARMVPEFDLSPEIGGASAALAVQQRGPTAMIAHLADTLSRLIGPYARIAVMRAGDRAQTYDALCRDVAREIDDPAKRARFLRDVLPVEARTFGAGTVLAVRRNAGGHLTAEPGLRARGELAILAIPPDLPAQAANVRNATG